MYKNRFFKIIRRVMGWIDERRQELYFIIMGIFILTAIGFGVYMYRYSAKYPLFTNPSTLLEYFAQAIFISMVTIGVTLLFGAFIAHFIIMIPFKRLKLFKMEMEFDSTTKREQQIKNEFLYTSTMLYNHTENVKQLSSGEFVEFKQVLRLLTDNYRNYAAFYNDELSVEMEVLSPAELEGKESSLFKDIRDQTTVKVNTSYVNRLVKDNNLLVGRAVIEGDTEEVAVVIRQSYDHPFDTYEQEAIESILAYATILYDTIIMIQLLTENNMFDQKSECED